MRCVFVRLAFGLILFHLMLIFVAVAVAHTQPPRSSIMWSVLSLNRSSSAPATRNLIMWDGQSSVNLTKGSHGSWNAYPAWSRDGWLAWVSTLDANSSAAILVWDRSSVQRIAGAGFDSIPVWSPDGDRLAWRASVPDTQYVRVWDRQQGLVLDYTLPGYVTFRQAPIWSSGGLLAWETFACARNFGPPDILIWNGYTVFNLTNSPYGGDCFPSWSSDNHLAWVSDYSANYGEGAISLWDGTMIRQLGEPGYIIAVPVWSNDGRLAWITSDMGRTATVHIWDGTSITHINVPSSVPDRPTTPLHWSPDGSHLAWTTYRGNGISTFYVWDGTSLTALLRRAVFEYIRWLDDQRILIIATHANPANPRNNATDLVLWDGHQPHDMTTDGFSRWNAQMMPDGRLAWTQNDQGTISLVIWAAGQINVMPVGAWDSASASFVVSSPYAGE